VQGKKAKKGENSIMNQIPESSETHYGLLLLKLNIRKPSSSHKSDFSHHKTPYKGKRKDLWEMQEPIFLETTHMCCFDFDYI